MYTYCPLKVRLISTPYEWDVWMPNLGNWDSGLTNSPHTKAGRATGIVVVIVFMPMDTFSAKNESLLNAYSGSAYFQISVLVLCLDVCILALFPASPPHACVQRSYMKIAHA